MIYKITDGYLVMELVNDTIENIRTTLLKISKEGDNAPAANVEQIKKPEDIEKIGERKGNPSEFIY
jgi:hypothetical protein